MWLLRHLLLRSASRAAGRAAARHQPAVIVSCHPLTGFAAVSARRRCAPGTAVLTVVTDLGRPHASWRCGPPDAIAAPSAASLPALRRRWPAGRRRPGSPPVTVTGLPVTSGYRPGPARPDERAALRRTLGLPADGFLVLLAGGGEGCGGLARRAAAILDHLDGVHVAVICGRNQRLRRRLGRLAVRSTGRSTGRSARRSAAGPAGQSAGSTVRGFVPGLADWLRCADLCVTKAGPGTIAEAACCGTPLLLTSHLPGQERDNAGLVIAAGAPARPRHPRHDRRDRPAAR